MIKKKRLLLFLGLAFLVFAGMMYQEDSIENFFATLNVRIEKDSNNIWRVRDINGNSRGALHANSNDKIQWQTRHSDVVFAFSKDVNAYFEFKDGLFADGRTQRISRNGNLMVTVKEDAPADTLVYEVFVVSEGKFVQANSPPVIIIKK